MFSKLRRQLTIFNTVLFGISLLIFVGIIMAGMIWGIYADERDDLFGYAKEEAEENLSLLKEKTYLQPGFLREATSENATMFFYVYDNQGRLAHYANGSLTLNKIIVQKAQAGLIKEHQPTLIIMKQIRPKIKVFLTVLPIRENGIVYGTIYVGKDIADLYRILQKLASYMVVITLLFLGLTAVLGFIMAGRSLEPIKKTYEKQREFLADASHELRTPLSILLTSVESIQSDAANRLTHFSGQVLADMKDEIKKMSKIVNDLITLARSDTAVLNLFREHFELQPVAEQVIRTIYPLAQRKNIDLQLTLPAPLTVYADRERLAQLLLILVDNAVKYTPEGGRVQLTIRRFEGRNGSGVEIVVLDNGSGIADAEQDLIFERFYRADKARSRSIGGSGLGLPIAKWIVEQHGGSIKVVSKLGAGSQFVVVLPL